jgi:hypothetical protein
MLHDSTALLLLLRHLHLIASPALAGMYALGLKWKGPWIGLPFLGVAIIFFLGGLGVWCYTCLKVPREEMPCGDEDQETYLDVL